MKRKRFSVEQIVAVLKQAEAGMPVAELIRHVGISEQAFYRWKKAYAGLQTDQVRQLKQLQDENAQLKKVVAELTLDKAMLTDVLKKMYGPPRLCTRAFSDETVCVNVSGLSRVSRFWRQGHDGICALGSQ